MIEILLKILLSVFSVFGLYAFAHMLGEIFFQNDNIKWMIWVDSMEIAEQIELYLEEAKSASFLFGNKRVCAIVMEKYATEELLQTLRRKRIPYKIVLQQEESMT